MASENTELNPTLVIMILCEKGIGPILVMYEKQYKWKKKKIKGPNHYLPKLMED